MKHFWALYNHNYLWRIIGLLLLINCILAVKDENSITIEKLCDSRRDGIYGYKQCSNRFIYCSNHVPTVAFCAEGTIFDEYSRECVHKSVATYCSRGTKNEDIETTSKSHSMDDPVLELDKMCVNDNFVFSDDCSAVFWKCSNGVAHSFKCPSGLVFNKETGSCGFADEVDSCSKKFDEFRRAQTFRRLSSNVAGEKLAKEFSYDVMTFERYCDSKDVGVYSFSNCSSRYYVCGKNSFNIAKCPLSYMFNPETRRCESSTEFTCTPDRKDHDGKLKGGNFTCDGKADGYYGFGGFYKDFYGCLNGELFYYSCERGLYFNPVSQYCEHFRNDDNPKETGLSRYDSYKKKNKTEFDCSRVPHGLYSFGCSPVYFSCESDQTVMKRCSLGHVFNQKTLACASFTECQATIKEVELEVVVHGVRCSNESEYKTFGCKPYYIYCCNGEQYLQYCASGEIFDPQLGVCTSDHLCNVYDDHHDVPETTTMAPVVPRCLPRERSPIGQCMPEYLECNEEGNFVKYACDDGKLFDHQRGFCRPSEECDKKIANDNQDEEKCTPGKTSSIMSCHNFYFLCNELGKQSILQCSNGTLYDENFGYCRPENVCGKVIDTKPSSKTTPQPRTHKMKECKTGEVMVIVECGKTYTECNEEESFQIRMCPEGTGFDSRESKCVSLHRCGKTLANDTVLRSTEATTVDEHEVLCKPGELDIIYECSPNYLLCNEKSQFTIHHCGDGFRFDGTRNMCLPEKVCGKLTSPTAPPKMQCKPGHTYSKIDCDKGYFHCSSHGQYEYIECTGNFVFSSQIKQCVEKSFCARITTTTASAPTEKCRDGEILVIDDCFQKYSECNKNGEYKIKKCKKGYVFDGKKMRCVKEKLCGLMDTSSLVLPTTMKPTKSGELDMCTPGTYEIIDKCFQQFLHCNDLGRIEVKSCPKGFVFELSYGGCVDEYICEKKEAGDVTVAVPTSTPYTTTYRTTTVVAENTSNKCVPRTFEIIDVCFRQFLECNNQGKFEVKSCPEGFVFDIKYNGCVDKYICDSKVAEETTALPSSTKSYTTTSRVTIAPVAEDQSQKCAPRTLEIVGECFQQFLECNDEGEFEVKNCPEGFVFDMKYHGCIDKYICGNTIVDETTVIPPSTIPPYTTTSRTTKKVVSGDSSDKCLPDTIEVIDECFQQFLQCNQDGKFEIKSCPEGFVFEAKYNGCVDRYTCGHKEVEGTTVVPSPTKGYTTTSKTIKTPVSEDQTSKCAPGTFEVIGECFQQFLECDDEGKFEVKNCPEEFVFDTKYNGCVEKYACGNKVVEETTVIPPSTIPPYTTTSRTMTTTTVSGSHSDKCVPGSFEIIDECFQQFLECNDEGEFEVKNCPGGFVFDTKYNGCVEKYACGNKVVEETTVIPPSTIAPYTTTSRTTIKPVSKDQTSKCTPGTFEVIGECFQQFLECNDDGIFEVKNCPKEFAFDTRFNGCVDKYACGNKVVEETTVIPPSTIPPYTTTSRTMTTTTVSGSHSDKCVPGSFEIIDECFQQFLECNEDGKFGIKNCPEGFVFDTKYNGCVDEYICTRKVVEETTVIPPSTIPPYTKPSATTSRTTTTAVPMDQSSKCAPGTLDIIGECFQQFLECDEYGMFGVKNCPEGFVFDTKYNGCVELHVCGSKVIEETTVIPPSTLPLYTKPSATTSRTTTTTVASDHSDKCAPGSFEIIDECFQQFLECNEYGMFGIKNCPEGFVFDRKYSGCVESYVCGHEVIEETTVIPPSTLPPYTKPPATTSRTTTTAVPMDQSSKCTPGTLDIIGECFQQFLECDEYGMFGVKNCPDGFVFDTKYNGCVELYVCGNKVIEETTVIPPSTLPPYTKPYSTTSRTPTTTVASDHSDKCAPGSFEIIDECFQQFLECNEYGMFGIKNCPEGFVFDRKYSGCVESYVCGREVTEETTVIPPSTLPPYVKPYTTTSRITTTTVSSDHSDRCVSGTFETVGECFQQFLECNEYGIFRIKNCPEGFVFDKKYSGCVESYVCGHEVIEETTVIPPSTLPPYTKPYTTTSRITTTTVANDQNGKCDPKSIDIVGECSRQFLQCSDYGEFEVRECPEGFVFSPKYFGCVELHICRNEEVEETTTVLPSYTKPYTKPYSKDYTTTSRTTTTIPHDDFDVCVPGTYEAIDKCFQQFLECNHYGKFEIKKCPEGFVFDTKYNGCVDGYICDHQAYEGTTTTVPYTTTEKNLLKCVPGTHELIDECSQQYLECNYMGKIEVKSCPRGFVFDLESRGCIDDHLCNDNGPDYTTTATTTLPPQVTQETTYGYVEPTTSKESYLQECRNGEIKEIGSCHSAFLFCDLSSKFVVRNCGYGKVFDETKSICVNSNDCGVEPSYSTSTIRAPTCKTGDLMVTSNCMTSYFECNEDNVFEVKHCYGDGVFDESRNTCVDRNVCGRGQDVVTQPPIKDCNMGSFVEIDECSQEYAECNEYSKYVIRSCQSNYVFSAKSNSCILKEDCGSEPTTAQAPITATAECTVGSFKEISPCSNSYLKCDETGVYVYTNCESDFVFDRNTLSCVSSQKCKGNDVGYGTDSSTGYGTDSGTGYGADSSTGYESRRPYNWYENHKPTPIGPETDDVVDRFGFIDPYPHDLHSIAHTYPSKEELEGEGVKDDFSVNTIIPKRYVSPYDMNNDVDDLNLYEPVLSMGPLRSGYPDLPDHDNHDFVLDDFLGDTNDHFDRHFGYRTNYMDEVKEDFVMDRFLDTSDALHHDLGHYYPGHISDDGNHYQADEFVLPPDVDSHHKFGHHHPGGHNEHYQYGEPHYNNYDLNNNVVYDHEFIGNYRTKRSTDGEQSVGPDNFSTQSSNKSNYHFIFEHSTNSIRCLKDFCNRTVNNLAPIGFCTEEFINCTNLDDVFVQRCGDRNVFDGKTGECISYDVCLNSKPVQLARSLMFDEDVLDDNVCVELGDGIYYKDGCGKYFVVCNKNRMNHMHCPRDMYFDVNRFQCDYIENVDACKYTSFNGGEVHSTDSMSRFNCKNVPNGFIGHECSNTFAYCQNEVVRRKFRCPRNHVFDSTSRLCVLPEMVPACDNNPMFADPRCLSNPNRAFGSHCSSVIHHCLNGRHYTYPCGENKLLNNITMRCLPVGELKECENMDKLRLLGSEVENYCKVGEIRNMAIEPCNTEYIKCLKSGQQLYVKCEDGLVYDEQDDNCTQSDLCIVKYSLNVTNADTTEVPSYIERDKSLLVVVDPVCEGKGENEFVPTGACKKEYIECIKTTAVRRSCPNNYIFSKEKNSCVYKFTSMECELPKFNDQEEFKDTNDVPPFDAAKFCVGKENRFYRNPQNCTIAVRCYEEKTHAMYSCARGLVYDEDNQKCDYAQKFKRCIGSDVTTPAVNISTDVECTIANHGLFIPDASDCSKYYRCVWGTLIERKCPQTTKFNPKFSVCDFPITPDSCEFR